MNNNMWTNALKLARKGIPVFPCRNCPDDRAKDRPRSRRTGSWTPPAIPTSCMGGGQLGPMH